MKKSIILTYLIIVASISNLVYAEAPIFGDFGETKTCGEKATCFDSTHSFDVLSYDLDITISPDDARFDAVNHFTAIVADTPITIFKLNSRELEIDSIKQGNTDYSFFTDDSLLYIFLGAVYNAGDTINLNIYYYGIRGGDDQKGFYFNDSCAYTMSEPYDARYWIPCFDEPYDKVKFQTSITVPNGYTAVSNGEFLGSEEHYGDSTTTFNWREDHPIATYLMAITVARYINWIDYAPDGEGGSIPIYYYVYPEDSSKAVYDFANVPSMISYFVDLFGDYPFDKYGMVAASKFKYGGMEHQSISTINRKWIKGDRTSERGMAHELAHQWWGDLVTLADFRHIWLNEGFATYSQILWLGDFYGEDRYYQELRSIMNGFFYENDSVSSYPIYDPPYTFGAACYWKGAYVLEMLRAYLGDGMFFEILREYAEQFAYGNASTDDFRGVCEEISGKDLGQFFNQWVYTAGYPKFSFNIEISTDINGYKLEMDADQLQSETVYETFLDFKAYKEGIEMPLRFFITSGQQHFTAQLPFYPDSVIFNPDLTLLAKEITTTDIAEESPIQPNSIGLYQNYPNPFNSSTAIPFRLNGSGVLSIFNLNGGLVKAFKVYGEGKINWDSKNLNGVGVSSGIYIYRLRSGGIAINKRMILLK